MSEADLRSWKDMMRRRALDAYPLIPLKGHRMMPTVTLGQHLPFVRFPVLSMHGNDCIAYGASLWHWLAEEFPDAQLGCFIPPEWQHSVRAAEPALYQHWARYIDVE